ncbi:MAG TPA: acyl-CoA thioester hydrolase [Alphaproteobacteria bacterium]|nr:acyl-CoA thioester hydrolase [Alphaproteobacteria bacterium]
MRWVIRIVVGLLVIGGLGLGALWVLKPWVPEIQMAEPGETGRRIAEQGLLANYFPAEGSGPHPAIILLGGSEGGLARAAVRTARELQKAGFSVLHVSYFRGAGQPYSLEEVPLETFDRARDWLKAQALVDANRIGMVGISKGAEAALLYASRNSDIRAVVAGVPSNVVWVGINWDYGGAGFRSSWAQGGKALPHLPFGTYDWNEGVVSGYRNGLKALDQHQDAIIPVEKIAGPLLLICGEADRLWPSCDMARLAEARAKEKGAPAVTVLAYADAGHAAFGVPLEADHPNFKALGSIGGSPEGNNAAREDSWPKTLAFLREHLGPPPQ